MTTAHDRARTLHRTITVTAVLVLVFAAVAAAVGLVEVWPFVVRARVDIVGWGGLLWTVGALVYLVASATLNHRYRLSVVELHRAAVVGIVTAGGILLGIVDLVGFSFIGVAAFGVFLCVAATLITARIALALNRVNGEC